MNSTLYTDCNRLTRENFLKFKCRLDSSIGHDVHRDFVGVYYPRWRALYLDEVRHILGEVKLSTEFPFDVYLNKDEQYFFVADFVVGAKLCLGKTSSQRDKGVKTFVITDVDSTNLRAMSESVRRRLEEKEFPKDIVDDLVRIREAFVHQAAGSIVRGIKDIGRRFRAVDDNGDRKVNNRWFQKTLHEVHLDFSLVQINNIFSHFDSYEADTISFNELLDLIRGPMSEIRKAAVAETFRKIDANNSGTLTQHELGVKYNFSFDPDVLSGNLTEHQATNLFFASWDTRDTFGLVTYAEFCDYYSGISAIIEEDADFLQLLRQCWKV